MSFAEFTQMVREEGKHFNDKSLYIGEVVSVNPIRVKTNGVILDSDQLKVATYLSQVTSSDGVIESKKLKETLGISDELLLMRSGSYFIITCKLEGI
ncbi:DUF2577 family protein [Metabacillus sp. B2-18]|uniref:DUF2577 family protein n=1 Tax=Metabacillus sp. B2-18 TaxID=2897333 RepID=UPI001E64DF39|nr:DUF2577 family protein [Metabacillus sp. B2-18]UGB31714.1 DUF2577 domain-containing protein [Metabacillus sp. B2-18]